MKKCLIFFIILFCVNFELLTIKAHECGKKEGEFKGTVYGGKKTEKAEWPWIVAFLHRKYQNFFCGGTLISEKHVLSGEVMFFFRDIFLN